MQQTEAGRLREEAEVCRRIAWGTSLDTERRRPLDEADRLEAALAMEQEPPRAAQGGP